MKIWKNKIGLKVKPFFTFTLLFHLTMNIVQEYTTRKYTLLCNTTPAASLRRFHGISCVLVFVSGSPSAGIHGNRCGGIKASVLVWWWRLSSWCSWSQAFISLCEWFLTDAFTFAFVYKSAGARPRPFCRHSNWDLYSRTWLRWNETSSSSSVC